MLLRISFRVYPGIPLELFLTNALGILPAVSPNMLSRISPKVSTGDIPGVSTKVPSRISSGEFHGFPT